MRTDWLYHPITKISIALLIGFLIWANACSN